MCDKLIEDGQIVEDPMGKRPADISDLPSTASVISTHPVAMADDDPCFIAMRADNVSGGIDAKYGGVLESKNRSQPILSMFAEALLHELKCAINTSTRALDTIGIELSHVLYMQFGNDPGPFLLRYRLHTKLGESLGSPEPTPYRLKLCTRDIKGRGSTTLQRLQHHRYDDAVISRDYGLPAANN